MLGATPVSPMRHWRWRVRGGRAKKILRNEIKTKKTKTNSGLTQHSPFYRGGRGVALPSSHPCAPHPRPLAPTTANAPWVTRVSQPTCCMYVFYTVCVNLRVLGFSFVDFHH